MNGQKNKPSRKVACPHAESYVHWGLSAGRNVKSETDNNSDTTVNHADPPSVRKWSSLGIARDICEALEAELSARLRIRRVQGNLPLCTRMINGKQTKWSPRLLFPPPRARYQNTTFILPSLNLSMSGLYPNTSLNKSCRLSNMSNKLFFLESVWVTSRIRWERCVKERASVVGER